MSKLLDLESLDEYLKAQLNGLDGRPEVHQYRGGASNLTFRLDYPERSLIVRRAPPGTKAKGAHDMLREARILSGLRPQFGRVPEVYLACDDTEVIGAPFYVMEKLDGLILRGDLPEGLEVSPEQAARLCESLVETWVALHAVDVADPALAWLDRGTGYVGRQIGGWSKRYRAARTPDAPDFEAVMGWLADHPEDSDHCLIHNDFRFDNLVLDRERPEEVVGVLDWELATIGDPLMDLGAALAYWVQSDDDPGFHVIRRQPTHIPGMFSRDELVGRYLELSGRSVDDFVFYEVYGLFRLAGIAQQIYYRYYHGQFGDEQFADFVKAVQYLEVRCNNIISNQ
ncbi:MAG: phosphotransferase family protein [Xanthomonadales bacterium]|nr:phosphotransferase family protein [Xanthomonadales bacterium]